jgi:hypothetical protein
MAEFPMPPDWVTRTLREGIVIPAHPLALTSSRKLDECRQQALTRYYHAAGAGGVAVGVHTTQFAIRDPKHGLLRPVLELAAQTVAACDSASLSPKGERGETVPARARIRQTVRIAGICGATSQALVEAELARSLGFHAGLLSLNALKDSTDDQLIAHSQTVAGIIPLIGFYLQPAADGRLLSFEFWRRFVEIPNLVAIKIAPFNRYQTLDVIRAVAESDRAHQIALYTGNDDNIVVDLLTEYAVAPRDGEAHLRIVGGLLGHWACWTKKAVDLLNECKQWRASKTIPASLLTLAAQVTDANAAFFDPAHNFAGCIPGIHEVLRRQGLLEGTWCLDPNETLSPGQAEEINRIYRAYPHLNDDAFVQQHLDEWLAAG